MTIKMAKHPITMTIMRMTSTPGTVRLCCCCYCYNFFFVFICFVCFFFSVHFKFLLNSFWTNHGIKFEGFESKLVCQFLYLFFVCLFANSDMSIPEDIDEQLSSLNGYFTSDRTVSQASGEDLDFAEDILNFWRDASENVYICSHAWRQNCPNRWSGSDLRPLSVVKRGLYKNLTLATLYPLKSSSIRNHIRKHPCENFLRSNSVTSVKSCCFHVCFIHNFVIYTIFFVNIWYLCIPSCRNVTANSMVTENIFLAMN